MVNGADGTVCRLPLANGVTDIELIQGDLNSWRLKHAVGITTVSRDIVVVITFLSRI
jgi:hypothetical protein